MRSWSFFVESITDIYNMTISVEVPDYNTSTGLIANWEGDFVVKTAYDGEFLLQANKEGLISLAIQLLTLAQDSVPVGSHFHYDGRFGSLEEGSIDFVIDKIR